MSLPPRIDSKAVREQIGVYADKVATLDERNEIYRELIGFVPPRIEARMAVTGALDFKTDAAPEASRLDFAFDDATVIFPVAFLKSFEAQLSGNVAVTGAKPPFKVSGDVKVNRARSTK